MAWLRKANIPTSQQIARSIDKKLVPIPAKTNPPAMMVRTIARKAAATLEVVVAS